MASDDAALARLFFNDNPEYKRHPNYTKTDQLPISEVITGLPRPYHHTLCLRPVTLQYGVVGRTWVVGREFESHVHHENAF